MLNPPFKLASFKCWDGDAQVAEAGLGFRLPASPAAPPTVHSRAQPERPAEAPTEARKRVRLVDMDQYLHCSILGTCLSTAELRKLMSRFIHVDKVSDVDIHHEAVSAAGEGGALTKSLQKALDQRHAVAVQHFAAARTPEALAALWDQALAKSEIPGAYWAVLTHRDLTRELLQKVFGDVHMLSHLVGAANRADIRRLVAIERENADLVERFDKQQQRRQALVAERNEAVDEARGLRLANESSKEQLARAMADSAADISVASQAAEASALAVQTQRRERAEQAAAASELQVRQLSAELELLRRQADELARELGAAETQLRELSAEDPTASTAGALQQALRGVRVMYVGGRPSSTPAIRDVVERNGGEIKRHDGGFEDRKGLLAASVSWAHVVVFPVDCIDHDSALNLKQLCLKHGVPFIPLRTASVASFVAAIGQRATDPSAAPEDPSRCFRSC